MSPPARSRGVQRHGTHASGLSLTGASGSFQNEFPCLSRGIVAPVTAKSSGLKECICNWKSRCRSHLHLHDTGSS